MNVDEDVIKESIGHMHKTILMLTVCFPLFLDDVGENIEKHIYELWELEHDNNNGY